MQTAHPVLSLLIILLSHSGWTNGFCTLENGTLARCHELADVKYIETYDLESLKAPANERIFDPDLLENLNSLRHLDLSNGLLERVEPGSFRKLVNLRSLDLADNRIEYLDLASMDGLNHLRSLNLRRNNLRQLPPTLARLKSLRYLDVQGNPLQCNCATLRVKDLLAKRGVKISKKVLCAGPNNMKGTSLLKPDTAMICALEEQDRDMQRDQGYEGSGDELGSGDIFDEIDDDEEEVLEASSEASKEPEIETPFPETVIEVSHESSTAPSTTTASSSTTSPGKKAKSEEEEIYFDTDDNKERAMTTVASTTEKKVQYKDALFYPSEGSGDDEDGSGEGSGTGIGLTDWMKPNEETDDNSSSTSWTGGDSLLDILISSFWSTTRSPEVKDPDLEEEQFIDVSPTKEAEEEEIIVPKKVNLDESAPTTVKTSTTQSTVSPTSSVELMNPQDVQGTSKLDKMEAKKGLNDELAEVSPAIQSKKGMGSYIVLAALLAILATLIGFAAYKGDFCRKKRKRTDVENGTELKDMQKALLESGNSSQPKIASNGNVENVPLVDGTANHDDAKTAANDHRTTVDVPKASNGTSDYTDPVKPPRRTTTPQGDVLDMPGQHANSLTSMDRISNNVSVARLSDSNVPPLSPGAQRVKITLQENPDSVPKTPILITRTLAGENLVKTP